MCSSDLRPGAFRLISVPLVGGPVPLRGFAAQRRCQRHPSSPTRPAGRTDARSAETDQGAFRDLPQRAANAAVGLAPAARHQPIQLLRLGSGMGQGRHREHLEVFLLVTIKAEAAGQGAQPDRITARLLGEAGGPPDQMIQIGRAHV